MCNLPMETSFGHWNTSLLSQDENPIIGRIFAGNPNIQFFRCLPNWDVISLLNLPNSHDPNGGTYVVSSKTVSWGLKLLCYPLCLQGSDTEEKGVPVKCN